MRFVRWAVCFGFLSVACGIAGAPSRADRSDSGDRRQAGGAGPQAARKSTPLPEVRVANDDWADRLRSDDFWRHTRSPRPSPEPPRQRELGYWGSQTPRRPAPGNGRQNGFGEHAERKGKLRTVCVRLCDGYYWPLSFAATRTQAEADRRRCEESCASPARLYSSWQQDGEVADMRDASGEPYRDLKTAFLYRSAYLDSCKCRAHPWEAEALERHAGYAEDRRSGRSPAANAQAQRARSAD